MDIGSVLGLSGTSAGSQDGIAGDATLGREDFLNLLLVQLQMQDPLEPMDNREMVAQLAQFSSLEQLENMNTALEQNLEMDLLVGQLLNNTMATTLIGRWVRARTASFTLKDEGEVSLAYRLEGEADKVTASIRNADGAVIATIEDLETTAECHEFSWDGRDQNGQRATAGAYTFEITAVDSEGNPIGTETLLVGLVGGVRYEDGCARLLIDGGEVQMSDVFEILQGQGG